MSRTVGPHERNVAALRQLNETECLIRVRDEGPVTIAQIAKLTGLSRPTVETVMAELETRRIVRLDDPRMPEGKWSGRPAKRYVFNGSVGYLAGVEVSRSVITAVVADLAGVAKARATEPVAEGNRGADLVGLLRTCLDRACHELGIQRADLLAAGIGLPGAVSKDGRLVASTELPEWVDVDLVAKLGASTGCPAVVDSAINLALIAEQHMGAARLHDDVVLVRAWEDLSAAIMLHGNLHRGRSNRAGEIGLFAPGSLQGRGMSLERVGSAFERAAGGDTAAMDEVDRFATELSQGIATLVRTLDPELVVLGGELAEFGAILGAEVREHLASQLDGRVAPQVATSTLRRDAVLIGAVVSAYGTASRALFGASAPAPVVTMDTVREVPGRGHGEVREVAPSPSRVPSAARSAGQAVPGRKLRLGVVGLGARSGIALWAHGEELNARVVGVADPDRGTHARAREVFGTRVQCFNSHDELLAMRPALEAVIVTSPDYTHASVTQDFLRAGVPVFLEKPFATTVQDADAILTTAYETGTKLYVGHNMRHMAVVRLMRDIIGRGEIGEVKAIWCRHFVGHGGDFYFKDWHAERQNTTSLVVHKGAHDIDVMHWLAGGYTQDVTGMGDLVLYGDAGARSAVAHGQDVSDSLQTWPPESHDGLNPIIDVEDTSMISMRLDNGVLCSYEQCHFTPDYWRNYTVIGTLGRLENFGDSQGGVVRVWNHRHAFDADGDLVYRIEGDARGHDDADRLTIAEFLEFVRDGRRTSTSPLGARQAAVAGIMATESLRQGSQPRRVPPVDPQIVAYFENGQSRAERGELEVPPSKRTSAFTS